MPLNPIPNHGTGGYAITLQFPPFDKVTGVSAEAHRLLWVTQWFFRSDPEHRKRSSASSA